MPVANAAKYDQRDASHFREAAHTAFGNYLYIALRWLHHLHNLNVNWRPAQGHKPLCFRINARKDHAGSSVYANVRPLQLCNIAWYFTNYAVRKNKLRWNTYLEGLSSNVKHMRCWSKSIFFTRRKLIGESCKPQRHKRSENYN